MTRYIPVVCTCGENCDNDWIIKPDGMSLEAIVITILQDPDYQSDANVKLVIDYYNRMKVIENWNGHPNEYIYKFVLRDEETREFDMQINKCID